MILLLLFFLIYIIRNIIQILRDIQYRRIKHAENMHKNVAKVLRILQSFKIPVINTFQVTSKYSKIPIKANIALINKRFYISSQTNVELYLTDIGEGIQECEILQYYIKIGQKIKQFDPICQVQSDKATVDITSRYDGTVSNIHYNVGDIVPVNSSLVTLNTILSATPTFTNTVLASPAVRKLAKDKNIDLNTLQPTGKSGEILLRDVMKHAQCQSTSKDIDIQPQQSISNNIDVQLQQSVSNKIDI